MKIDPLDELVAITRARRSLPDPESCRTIRLRAGVSQERVAEAIGVERQTIARWETGTTAPRGSKIGPYLRALEAMARETGNTHLLFVEPASVGADDGTAD